MKLHVLITGAAGFIGSHLAARLAQAGHTVVGCDDFNPYYAPSLKHARVAALLAPVGVHCHALDIAAPSAVHQVLAGGRFDVVVNLAAQAGVRHSASAPMDYVHSNLVGFARVLEACREHRVGHLIYASSSSVYGHRDDTPFHEADRCDAPTSFYAATKAANELMAHAHAAQHGLVSTAVRLFTVYGPWGRPDMAYYQFARNLVAGNPVPLFGEGRLLRDYTFVNDTVEALARMVQRQSAASSLPIPHAVFNVGHRHPVSTLAFARALAQALGCEATLDFKPTPPTEVPVTCADDDRLIAHIGPWPATPLADGLAAFVRWFKDWDHMSPSPQEATALLG